MRIMITSVGTATSVNLIRYFKNIGEYILGTDIYTKGMTAGSLLVDSFFIVPPAKSDDYVDAIVNIVERERVDVLIPINDEEVYALAANKNKVKCKCVIPSIDIIENLRDKYLCSSIVRELGIAVPEILIQDRTDIKRILRDRLGVGSKGINVLEKAEVCPIYDTMERFLQRFIQGEEYTVDVLSDKRGEPIYIVPRKRLEVKSGIATKVLISNDETLIEAVKVLLRRFLIPGFSNIQFIKDSEGVNWFVEINYRFSGCGAATLATSPKFLKRFLDVVNDKSFDEIINEDTRWNSIVTRYYEEIVYESSIS